ncbi:flagellar protein FlbD [Acidaminobacter sp. JC074]|uniref:flagellar FlbD family protein n=1 Tax=Acidaminobacter sp. JC074 TaxID=2530199 RepID=UPI001F0F56D1|nr:flagellar FlbD family protein [Acidaminobacter sp. JC074]MCH4888727.1 flagellar protein FlbD [Acidaminobacter sp. JC074]
MIRVTRLNGSNFYINEDHIEFIEETPDTVITLNNEKKLVVKESIEELIEEITAFRRKVFLGDTSHLIKGE